jgi:predicted dehydrogenase
MKSIRVGVVGTGWGQLQIEAFRRVRGAEVVAVCDVDEARAQNIAQRYKIAQIFSDYRDLITSVDLVSIAAPPNLHYPMACAAIEAGKHVLCEKPLSLYASDARELLAAANLKRITHAVDFEMRFLPALAYAKELIDEDYLGQLLRVDVTMTMARAWGSEHGNWAAEDVLGGGVLMELGSHFIDLLRWWFGDVKEALAGRRVLYLHPKPSPIIDGGGLGGGSDDAFWCVLQFARGGEALLNFVTGARHDPGWAIGAYGEIGSLVVQGGQLLGMREGDREMAILPIPKRLELGDKPRDPLMWGMAKLIERVVAKINGERDALVASHRQQNAPLIKRDTGDALRPFPDFRDGVAVARIIDAIRRASDEREWVKVE